MTRITISAPWATTMSREHKAFRLTDQLKGGSETREESHARTEKSEMAVSRLRDGEGSSETVAEEIPCITRVIAMEEGEWICVSWSLGKARHKIRLTTRQYALLRPTVGPVSPQQIAALTEAGKLCEAVGKGMELLGYGAVSRRRLTQKLTQRGFDRECADASADYLQAEGFLREEADALRFAEQGVRKLWGPRRIREDLYARSFTSEAIDMAMEALSEVDFEANCAEVIAKKYGDIPTDAREFKKMTAALMRLGYSVSQIKEACRSYGG